MSAQMPATKDSTDLQGVKSIYNFYLGTDRLVALDTNSAAAGDGAEANGAAAAAASAGSERQQGRKRRLAKE